MLLHNKLLFVPSGLLLFMTDLLQNTSIFLQTAEGKKYLAELQRLENGIVSLHGKGIDNLSASEINLLNFYTRRQQELTERMGAQLPFPAPAASA